MNRNKLMTIGNINESRIDLIQLRKLSMITWICCSCESIFDNYRALTILRVIAT